ncbi:hypothetical protein AJ81_02530 [Pseudothermotoga hypogea DSM 11164 = NBRC 106472]|uniref:Uncharacterized protein n=1 Tax=Pseudothermotoga hypogea DSM 11164 = NBRC 106472 TaxID=1123384 RepID=A0A0X1KTL4_9THEM|nr:hypothetical protein AJ81_02530 [Pseudothermotoga hypogea DSM 11164 = NBRC 106472]
MVTFKRGTKAVVKEIALHCKTLESFSLQTALSRRTIVGVRMDGQVGELLAFDICLTELESQGSELSDLGN